MIASPLTRGLLAALLIVAAPSGTLSQDAGATETAEKPAAFCHEGDTDTGRTTRLCIASATYDEDVCRAIETYAGAARLPAGYFARLVWQESRFNLNALSPAGAEGIAQFMPSTGRIRGLENAFNPAEALARSATYLRFLVDKFGNLGLAAAAYNSGEGRMSRFVAGNAYIPFETEHYVRIITGYSVDQWFAQPPTTIDYRLDADTPFLDACLQLAKTRTIPAFEVPVDADWQPWGVQLAADFSPQVARRMFERVRAKYAEIIGAEDAMLVAERNLSFGNRLRYHARIGRATQEEAQALCQQLRAVGGVCLVMKN